MLHIQDEPVESHVHDKRKQSPFFVKNSWDSAGRRKQCRLMHYTAATSALLIYHVRNLNNSNSSTNPLLTTPSFPSHVNRIPSSSVSLDTSSRRSLLKSIWIIA